MRIRLRDAFAIEAEDGTVLATASTGRRVQICAAYLVLHRRRAVPTDELADVLWDGAPPPSWPSSLREVLSHVRKLLALGGPTEVTSRNRCVRIVLPEPVEVDVEVALATAARITEALADGAPASDDRLTELAVALREVAGLPGHEVLAGEHAPWLLALRRRLDDARERAGLALARTQLAQGHPAPALAIASALVDEAPLSEPAHHLLMACQVALGRPGDALASFERCRIAFAEALGMDPPAQVQQLHLDILRGPTPSAAAEHRAAVSNNPHRTRSGSLLPGRTDPSSSPLVGRAAQTAQVVAALADGVPAVVVRGGRGIGRTRLMAHLGGAGVLPVATVRAVRCTDPQDRGAMLRALLPDLVDVPEQDLLGAAGRALRDTAEDGPVALLVDDVHLVDPAGRRFLLDVAGGRHGPAAVLVLSAPSGRGRLACEVLQELHRGTAAVEVELPVLTRRDVATLMSAPGAPDGAEEHREDLRADGTGLGLAAGQGAEAWDAGTVMRLTGGLPLLVAALLRARRSGAAAGGHPAVAAAGSALLADVSPDARRVLRIAATLGRTFDPTELWRCRPVATLPRCLDALTELIDARLLADELHDGRLRFHADLLRIWLQADSTPARRRLAQQIGGADAAAARDLGRRIDVESLHPAVG